MEKLARASLVLITFAVGLGSYISVYISKAQPVIIAGISIFLVTIVLLLVGHVLVGEHARAAVWLLDAGWTLALLFIGAAIEGTAIWFAVFVADSLQGASAPSDVAKALGSAIVGAFNVICGILFLRDFEAGTGAAYPGAAFKKLVKRRYRDKLQLNSNEWRAVWEQRAPGAKGWGFKARRKRAALIDGRVRG
jgi:hypothetical protein